MILCVYDAGSSWIANVIGFVLGIISDITPQSSIPGQFFAKVQGMYNGRKPIRGKVPQMVLILDSGITIHFFSNKMMMKPVCEYILCVQQRCIIYKVQGWNYNIKRIPNAIIKGL